VEWVYRENQNVWDGASGTLGVIPDIPVNGDVIGPSFDGSSPNGRFTKGKIYFIL
jgi:hypothetical protein